MKYLTALLILMALPAQAAVTAEGVPPGYDVHVILTPVVPPDITPPPVAGAALVYPTTRPSWCGAEYNFCISVADSAAGWNTHALTQKYPAQSEYRFQLEPGVHVARFSTMNTVKVPITLDGHGATLDCLNSVSKSAHGRVNWGIEAQGCLVFYGTPTKVRNLKIAAGSGEGPMLQDDGTITPDTRKWVGDRTFRCISVHGEIEVSNVDFVKCNHGMQGDGSHNWTITNSNFTQSSFRGSGYSHAVYSGTSDDPNAVMTLDKVTIVSIGGHNVKSGHQITRITNSNLTEGIKGLQAGDLGVAVHSTYNGLVEISDTKITQNMIWRGVGGQVKGSVRMLLVGPKADRCHGPGEWRLKGVTLIDNASTIAPKGSRIKFYCPLPTALEDLGGNTYNGAGLDAAFHGQLIP